MTKQNTPSASSKSVVKDLESFYHEMQETSLLRDISSVLAWDQNVMMPQLASSGRAKQRAYLARTLHQHRTKQGFLDLVDSLADAIETLSPDDAINVENAKRDTDRIRKLPTKFVSEKVECSAQCYHVWLAARPKNDFKTIQPHLERLMQLNLEEAEYIGYEEEAYDALLDKFEPHARTAWVYPLLKDLAETLKPLIQALTKEPRSQPAPPQANISKQQELNHSVLAKIGFSFDSGRLDPTAHPFATSMGPEDFRITTRYNESDALTSLYSSLHEAGHAFYESGLPKQSRGLALGESVSLGIHESQSLFWEDYIGRSRAFCDFVHPLLSSKFQCSSYSKDELWACVSHVKPSLIRVDADELTYSLHVFIRLEIELGLMRKEISVSDLPSVWNELYARHLGVEVPSDTDGVMQDVHWYQGAVGYFPTYALGKLYGAMLYEKASSLIPDFEDSLRKGEFSAVRNWLQENVHSAGKRFSAEMLIETVCGKAPGKDDFLRYVNNKFFS